MVISRSGIIYDLQKSHYRTEVDGIVFVFSSKLHLEKFKERLQENRTNINKSLSNRFNMDVNVSSLADVVLYRKIETRGFLIVNSEGIDICQRNNIIYDGGKVTSPNCNES